MSQTETPNLDELKGYVGSLFNLLADPHPGLMTWREAYEHRVDSVLGFFRSANQKDDLLGLHVPVDPKNLPKPSCPRCGCECAGFYGYVHKIQVPQQPPGSGPNRTLLFQSWCCPHADCRAILVTMPVGFEEGQVAVPGSTGWPGMPTN